MIGKISKAIMRKHNASEFRLLSVQVVLKLCFSVLSSIAKRKEKREREEIVENMTIYLHKSYPLPV